jgi:16S rRNA G966 N2-methylase RsmD
MKIPLKCLNVYTTKTQAEQINKIILSYINAKWAKESCIITDATACIGGNSVMFCKDFYKVICVEKENDIFCILKSNTEEYSNCQCYNVTYNYVKFLIRQDIIFIDPPWGGNEYKNKKNIKLYLDNIDVQKIINELYNFTDLIVLKAPINFDINSLNTLFWYHSVHNITKYSRTIYNIVVFYKRI